jgi:hypothetical protein
MCAVLAWIQISMTTDKTDLVRFFRYIENRLVIIQKIQILRSFEKLETEKTE